MEPVEPGQTGWLEEGHDQADFAGFAKETGGLASKNEE
jgi:hypothetical protein